MIRQTVITCVNCTEETVSNDVIPAPFVNGTVGAAASFLQTNNLRFYLEYSSLGLIYEYGERDSTKKSSLFDFFFDDSLNYFGLSRTNRFQHFEVTFNNRVNGTQLRAKERNDAPRGGRSAEPRRRARCARPILLRRPAPFVNFDSIEISEPTLDDANFQTKTAPDE
uniref:Uncharacterized protein n=1 Tax=Romanomermis culicivorax TaxID=13658 RepID=A0A915ILV4_ROMCU